MPFRSWRAGSVSSASTAFTLMLEQISLYCCLAYLVDQKDTALLRNQHLGVKRMNHNQLGLRAYVLGFRA